MKRFLVCLLVGSTLMAVGVTTLIFEFQKYEFVDVSKEFGYNENYSTTDITLKDKENLTLEVTGYYTRVIYRYDEDLKERIKFEYAKDLSYRKDGNTLSFNNHSMDDRDYMNDGIKQFKVFIKGLKQHKIYTDSDWYDRDATIIIHCSSAMKERIRIVDEHS